MSYRVGSLLSRGAANWATSFQPLQVSVLGTITSGWFIFAFDSLGRFSLHPTCLIIRSCTHIGVRPPQPLPVNSTGKLKSCQTRERCTSLEKPMFYSHPCTPSGRARTWVRVYAGRGTKAREKDRLLFKYVRFWPGARKGTELLNG